MAILYDRNKNKKTKQNILNKPITNIQERGKSIPTEDIKDNRAPIPFSNDRTPQSYERNKKRQSIFSTDTNIRGGSLPYRFATRPTNITHKSLLVRYDNHTTTATVIRSYLNEHPEADNGINPLSRSSISMKKNNEI